MGRLAGTPAIPKVISTELRGKTTDLPECQTCIVQSAQYSFGLGVVLAGDWVVQSPLFSGEAGAFAYLPSKKVAISVAVTTAQDALLPNGGYKPEVGGNAADVLWRQMATVLVPDDAPPNRKS